MARQNHAVAAVALLVALCLSCVPQAVSLSVVIPTGADNTAGADTVAKSSSAVDAPAKNRVGRVTLPENLSALDVLVLVCMRLQNVVPFCRRVPTFQARFSDRLFADSLPVGVGGNDGFYRRVKRSYGWPSYSYPSFDSGYGSKDNDYFPKQSTTFLCPSQNNFSAVYNLSGDSTDYPAAEIADELNNDPAALQCLAEGLEIGENGVPVDDFLFRSNVTCPFRQLRLWSFFSLQENARCHVIQNFQDDIFYRQCLSNFPRNCNPKEENKRDDDFFGKDWYNSWNKHPDSKKDEEEESKNVNLCITEYRRVSVRAFCRSLPLGQRRIREKIIIPVACTPFSVPCPAIKH